MIDVHYFKKDWIIESREERNVDVCIYGGTTAGVIVPNIFIPKSLRGQTPIKLQFNY